MLSKLLPHGDLPLLLVNPIRVSKVVQPALSEKVRDGDPGSKKGSRVIEVLKNTKHLRMVTLQLGPLPPKGGGINSLSVV